MTVSSTMGVGIPVNPDEVLKFDLIEGTNDESSRKRTVLLRH